MKDPVVKNIESLSGSIEKPQAAFTVLRTYVRQRFSIVTFGALALYLLVFPKVNLGFQPSDVLKFTGVLFFLLTMRLYDDLQNARFDQQKPGRIYTDPANAKSLYLFFAGSAVIVLSLLTTIDLRSGVVFLLFLLINHVLYTLLVNRSVWRYYLPLLKYPFIAGLIGNDPDLSAANLSLFFAFLTFDLIDDASFPLPAWSTIISSLIAFALLLPSVSPTHYVHIGISAIVTTGLTLSRSRYSGYAFLGLFLLARLIGPLYEI